VWAGALGANIISSSSADGWAAASSRPAASACTSAARSANVPALLRAPRRQGDPAGPLVGILRALTPFVAGTTGIALRRVLPYSAAGTLMWATTFRSSAPFGRRPPW